MRTNIFAVPATEVSDLEAKLRSSGMSIIKEVEQGGWRGSFFFSTASQATTPDWIRYFGEYFTDGSLPASRSYYAAFVFKRGDRCLVLSFGKAHFYIRPYCDYDYGIEIAKRIANEDDIRQTAAKRFNARRKKDIKSFVRDSRLDVESGESVEYIQAGIVSGRTARFGASGRFGTSVQLAPDITASGLGGLLSDLEAVLQEPARFAVARTVIISEENEMARLDDKLIDELFSPRGLTEFAHNSYDLYGVDFVFGTADSFVVSCPGAPRVSYETLSMGDLKDYIAKHEVPRESVLRIRIRHIVEDGANYTKKLKEAVDFIADDNSRVVLVQGKWMHFNQDYLNALNESLRTINVLETEPEFRDIVDEEGDFNLNLQSHGYVVADKNFDVLKTRASTQVEAWDLVKGDCVYAVKFGTAQKLGYVVDQATNTLEIIRNAANAQTLPHFSQYCLWLGYRAQGRVDDISRSGSIILKQKIETWARKARDLGIEPVLKISRKLKPGVEVPAQAGAPEQESDTVSSRDRG